MKRLLILLAAALLTSCVSSSCSVDITQCAVDGCEIAALHHHAW